MIAVITGDIINSRKINPADWQPKLKNYFSKIVDDPKKWAIYRGDSFQVEVEAEKSLEILICIKSLIKTNHIIDARMAVGIGEKDFEGEKVTESIGAAYINSGEGFEKLNNKTIILKSPFNDFDEYFNPILKLLSFVANSWKPVTAETIFFALTHKDLPQISIAELLGKDSSTINKALKRGAYEEIQGVVNLFTKKISQCLS